MEEQKLFEELQIESDEEEVYLLRIPKGIDPNVLLHAKVDLTKKCKVKTQSGVFHLKPIYDKPGPKYFLQQDGLKKIEPLTVLQLSKSNFDKNLKEGLNHLPQFEGESKSIITLPIDSIKDKHPLFGDKYKARIELQEEIKKKLLQAQHRFDKERSNSKRKKKNEEYEDKSLLISQILEAKFKRKKTANIENTKELDSCEINNEVHRNKKKRNSKHEVESSFQEHDIKSELQSDGENLETISNKKKKKKKHIESEESINIENTEEPLGNWQFKLDDVVQKDKNKKKRISKHEVESSFQEHNIKSQLPSDSNNLETISKKKKHIESEELINIENTEEALGNKKKKKRNSKHEAESSFQDHNIKKELQSDVENSEIISNIKKNKKKHIESKKSINIENTEEPLGNKKMKKRNSKHEVESSFQEHNIKRELQSDVENSEIISIRKKKKKKEHKDEHSSVTKSSICLENMNYENISIKKELQSDLEDLESSLNGSKIRKRRRDSEAFFPSQDHNNSIMPPAKKRRPSILSSTVIKESSPEFKPDLSAILGN